jgi:hypothetical protein
MRTQGQALTALRGADEICQAEAEDGVVPPGQYVAWLSTPFKNAKDRLPANESGYFLPSGIKIANNRGDLLDGTIEKPINETGKGIVLAQSATVTVFTGTNSSGNLFDVQNHCQNWTTSDSALGINLGGTGNTTATNSAWTAEGNSACGFQQRLYCFQR